MTHMKYYVHNSMRRNVGGHAKILLETWVLKMKLSWVDLNEVYWKAFVMMVMNLQVSQHSFSSLAA